MKALNVKIALLTCVGFTVAMCWLVSQVSRPLATAAASPGGTTSTPTNTSKSGESPRTVTSSTTATKPGNGADGLRRSNPIDVTRLANRGPHETAHVPNTPILSDGMEGMLPPVSAPRATNGEASRDDVRLASGTEVRSTPPLPLTSSAVVSAVSTIPEATLAGSNVLTAMNVVRESPVDAGNNGAAATGAAGTDAGTTVVKPDTYAVKAGDTLGKVAKKTVGKDDAATLQKFIGANPKLKSRPNKLFAGETLKIPEMTPAMKAVAPEPRTIAANAKTPQSAEAAKPTVTKDSAKTTANRDGKKLTPVAMTTSMKKAPAAATKSDKAVVSNAKGGKTTRTQWYTVKDKDTLPVIARRVLKDERRWPEIQSMNGLKPGSKVTAGMRLKVPASET